MSATFAAFFYFVLIVLLVLTFFAGLHPLNLGLWLAVGAFVYFIGKEKS